MSVILLIYIVATLFSCFVLGCLLGALFSRPLREKLVAILTGRRDLYLSRTYCNPVLRPGDEPWTAEAVMNPAALNLSGRVHLIYRAVGMDGVSRLGYASSSNGIVFDDRPPYPVYTARGPAVLLRDIPPAMRRYSPHQYPSGGSWGGCEDPRMVAIDGRVYVTYNAFDGWDFIRMALTSISEADFLAKRWRWRDPKLISRPGELHKNWVLFPEKVGGKFALLHSLQSAEADRVCIEYIDDLDTFNPATDGFASPYNNNSPCHEAAWHEKVRGVGPPPLRTDRGWLVLYHAHEKGNHAHYKLGAMLLDLDDPTKVLHRACRPILSPDARYENEGKPGIVYACGAIVRGDLLHVYYGGADKVVCVATAPLASFLDALVEGEVAELVPAPTRAR
ncbi:MAG: hypothetical protein KGI78_03150 [Patescibacteria group bacterium]|nr:hypothetical protein [Patescibacteria group bacterium]MDE1944568.1 hypothetical protein [Patescibacteria group bacterium]MDE1945530.1 hypothetical protein [Patescibacteria group bacterium]MDE2057827.1 hypothetical protein [Patescibacteria group bacterium]